MCAQRTYSNTPSFVAETANETLFKRGESKKGREKEKQEKKRGEGGGSGWPAEVSWVA